MTLSELQIAPPRGRGRAKSAVRGSLVRELTAGDVAQLEIERGIKPPVTIRLRDRHMAAARLVSQGLTRGDVALITGYTVNYLAILEGDPSFQELVEIGRRMENSLEADFTDRTGRLAVAAVGELHDRLEADEPLPTQMVLEIAKFAADRTGHAPISKNVNVNVNAGVGSRMEAARRRLALVRQDLLDSPGSNHSTEPSDAEFAVVEAPSGGDAEDG